MTAILDTLGGVKALLDIVKHARELRSGAPISVENANEVVVNLWGSILHELRLGVDRARLLVDYGNKGKLSFATFTFEICDAIFPEFCRLVPSPALLVPTAGLLAELRQIDHFQSGTETRMQMLAVAFAEAFLKRDGIGIYNDVLRAAEAFARAVYDKAPSESVSFLLPEAIDPSVPPVDHGHAPPRRS